ncbi:alpha/beta hydrolase, partial [Myxococcota bacterium]|nr:alpha/beta hydrolase [Myxococcota bacterium]
ERFVRLPADIVRVGVDVVTLVPSGELSVTFNRIPTSIDNMSPSNPFIRTLATIPVDPRVRSHSIIAVDDPEEPLERAGDGVVRYASAKIDGVDSETVVFSPHSGMQAAPKTIERVRQVLRAHSQASRCPIPGR